MASKAEQVAALQFAVDAAKNYQAALQQMAKVYGVNYDALPKAKREGAEELVYLLARMTDPIGEHQSSAMDHVIHPTRSPS